MTEQLCQRTNCLKNPGKPVKGMYCYFRTNKSNPLNAHSVCMFCGKIERHEEAYECADCGYKGYGAWNCGNCGKINLIRY